MMAGRATAAQAAWVAGPPQRIQWMTSPRPYAGHSGDSGRCPDAAPNPTDMEPAVADRQGHHPCVQSHLSIHDASSSCPPLPQFRHHSRHSWRTAWATPDYTGNLPWPALPICPPYHAGSRTSRKPPEWYIASDARQVHLIAIARAHTAAGAYAVYYNDALRSESPVPGSLPPALIKSLSTYSGHRAALTLPA